MATGNINILKHELQLVFLDEEGKESTVRISVPKTDVTLSAAKAVGDMVLAKHLMTSAKGKLLTGFKGAYMVENTSAPIID